MSWRPVTPPAHPHRIGIGLARSNRCVDDDEGQDARGKHLKHSGKPSAARLAAGISQEELGELAELHRTYIGDIERGERNVNLPIMHNLATALKTKLSVLIEEMETRIAKSSGSKRTPNVAQAGKPERATRPVRMSRKH